MARAKKAAPGAPETGEAAGAAPAAVAPAAIELVPLGRLMRAPENVRHTNKAVDVDSLADDIAAHGLLQNLIGYAGDTAIDKAAVYIVGGGRRLQALQLLRERGAIDDAFAVPVLLRPVAEAIELSLSENLAKRDMNPADEFLAFEALMKRGTVSPADLARQFGFSERYVKQRLRLAALAPEILDALRAGKLTIDAAMAYAGSQDHRTQMKVYAAEAKKGAHAHHAMNVRFGIAGAQMRTGDPLFKFVGAHDYEAKGGAYEDDLFSDAEAHDGRKLRDPDIILTIAADRAHFQQARVLAEAKAAHPTTSAVLLCPGLRLDRWPKAPKGYELVDKGWRSDLGDYPALRDKACTLGIDIIGICGVDYGGRLALSDRFFVPGGRIAEIIPPVSAPPRESEQERAARVRAREIRSVAAFLAAKAIRDEKVEGRQFWRTTLPDLWRTSEVEGIGECYPVMVDIMVTAAEIDAQMDAAEIEYDRLGAEEAAQRAAQQRAEEEAAAAEAQLRGELAAMDPPPVVVQLGDMLLFQWVDGCWYDEREVDDADPVYQFDDLADMLEWAEGEGAAVRGAWLSLEAYEAAHVPEVDAEAQVDQAA